ESRSGEVQRPERIRSRSRDEREPRMGGRHTRLLWRSARAAGGEHSDRSFPSPRGESQVGRGSAAVPEERPVPRPATPAGRRRRNPRLKSRRLKTEKRRYESIPICRLAEAWRNPGSSRSRAWTRGG